MAVPRGTRYGWARPLELLQGKVTVSDPSAEKDRDKSVTVKPWCHRKTIVQMTDGGARRLAEHTLRARQSFSPYLRRQHTTDSPTNRRFDPSAKDLIREIMTHGTR